MTGQTILNNLSKKVILTLNVNYCETGDNNN